MPRPPQPPPEFFIDRSLGNIVVASAIRELGHLVHTMPEVYPERADESVSDTRWIRDADEAGWIVFTKDERITRRPHEQAALVVSHLRIFAISNQHLTGPQMAGYYATNLNRILQRARRPGPFVDIVHPSSIERRWPRGRSELPRDRS